MLSALPRADELFRSELGYMKLPCEVYRLQDFKASEIARTAAELEKYSEALVFPTKCEPPPLLASLGLESVAMEERFFSLHLDLPPEAIAREPGREPVWKEED